MTTKDDMEWLFRTHYAAMYRLAMLILRDEDVARDIVHDVFETLLVSGRTDISGAYLLTAVRNRCLKHIRCLSAQDRMKAVYSIDGEIEDEDWPDEDTITLIQSTVSSDLSDACRRVVALRFTEGITDDAGHFSIPCDKQGVIGKLSCLGYKTTSKKFNAFLLGTILMEEHAVSLGIVTVEAENAHLYSDKSVYMPTATQKNSSQSGYELLNHIAIPQLGIISGNSITTNGGKPVAVFIDYLPASENDLLAMRVSDVKRVEYLEYPSDPRLQGNPYVINFIMQRYEYGGYVKAYGFGTFLNGHQEQMIGNVRMQYKRMTYDLMGSAYNSGSSHTGLDMTETFRLPQDDETVKQFERISELESSKRHRNNYYLIFKATYNSAKVQASTLLNSNLNRQPNTYQNGIVKYSNNVYPTSEYYSSTNNFSKFISFNGYYFFVLPSNNSITFTPKYSLSHRPK